jgi:hypothetical protein
MAFQLHKMSVLYTAPKSSAFKRGDVDKDRLTTNHKRVYQLVRRHGNLSRAELVRGTGLTFPSISRIASELVSRRLLRETVKRRGGMGKPPIELEVIPEHAFGVGLYEHSGRLEGVLLNAMGSVQGRVELSFKDDLLTTTATMLEKLDARSPLVSGVGLIRDGQPGTSAEVEVLEKTIGMPVVMATSAGAAALYEHYFGVAQGVANFFYLDFGENIRSALLLGDRLLAPEDQLRDVLHILYPGHMGQISLPKLSRVVAAVIKLVGPEAIVLGGDFLQERFAKMQQEIARVGSSGEILRAVGGADRFLLAAASLPLHKAYAATEARARFA